MSWFDAAGFATIAKSALKEAQRTIDKALDIKDEPVNTDITSVPPIDTNPDDFFGAWGLSQSGKIKSSDSSNHIVTTTPEKSSSMSTTLWGSFAGSFFETPKEKPGQRFSVDSLDDTLDLGDEGFIRSKLVVQHSDDGDSNIFSRLSSIENEEPNSVDPSLVRKTEEQTNRLSMISIDGKTSSESVEVVSGGTDCTTSPETDLSLRLISESVEVLPDSLTSPSSIEVLLTETENTDEYVSPLVSPIVEEKFSPDSVEVIVEDQDEDSVSFASISDSTSTTLLETNLIIKQPGRTNVMHLPLPPLIDTQPLGSKENIASLIECSNVIDIPKLSEVQNDDDGSQSDRTIIASDNVMESSSDTSTTTESFYLKTMIADAMTEKSTSKATPDVPPRETSSPLSSESRSDLVKIGSGHTSGDENETTTSSDIEIISSPNGDSSSTQSRQSPAKLAFKQKLENSNDALSKIAVRKIKGHNRELSETSSISDDFHSSEIDRLIKRITEMTEILELRESKLIEFSRHNAELQEINNELQHQLNVFLTKQIESADLSQVTEEYTQRLSILEKKFQQAIREKDNLKKQLDQTKQEAATRMSKSDMDLLISEKDEIINELRTEGGKLSKQQLQHSNIIKKLRAKEKDQETINKNLRENLEDLTLETERLKRSVVAKEEVERSQIEAVHKLTSKNKKLEFDISQLQGQVDDITQKYDTVKRSLDAAKKELVDKNKTSSELHAREQMLQSLENEKRITDSQNEDIINQLEDLRFKLQQGEFEYIKKEQNLRMENNELLRRLENAERRNEELAQSVTDISKPLIRQLDALQATHNTKLAAFEKVEQDLLVKIGEMQGKLHLASDTERLSREECLTLRSKISSVETQLNTLIHQNELMQMDTEQKKAEKSLFEQELKHEMNTLKQQLGIEAEEKINLVKNVKILEKQLSVEKVAVEAEKRRNSNLQEQIRERNDSIPTLDQSSPPFTGNTSPTLSLGHLSISESLGSSAWFADEQQFDYPTPRFTNMLELQMLQTNLKQREGEVQQLQWELNRREQEKKLLNSEISDLLKRVEQLELTSTKYEKLTTQFDELQRQYETLCQLYGEKVEETEELKLDLVDVKELYKAQLDEILRFKNNS